MSARTTEGGPVGRSGARLTARVRWLLGLLLTLILPAIVYLVTLYPGVGGRVNPGDSMKFQYIGLVLGVPHEPGYPQYVLLNYLWTSLPWPFEAALQVNLLSAVCSLLAGAFFWSALTRLTGRPLLAVLGTWTLLVSRSVWTFSTEAEVHGLQLLWACAAFWIAVRWTENRDRRWLLALLAVVALSFGNHPLAVMLLLGTAALVLVGEPRAVLSPQVLVAGLVFAGIGLAQYGFLMVRARAEAPYVEAIPAGEPGFADLWRGMTGKRFIDWHWMNDTNGVESGWLELLQEALLQLSLPVLLLALFGAVVGLRRAPPIAGFLLAVLAGSLAFYLAYHVPDPQPYQAHVWLPIAALATLGAAALPRDWWLVAAVVWGGFLVIHVGRDTPDLRVEETKWNRSTLMAGAPANSTVLLEQGSEYDYPMQQLANYYTYAFPDKRAGVEARPAVDVFASWEYLTRHPLVFSGDEVAEALRQRGVAFRPLGRWDGKGRPMFVTRVEPARGLELVPRPRGLELRRSGASVVVPAAPGVWAVVLDPRTPGVRAVLEVRWGPTPSTARRIWDVLGAIHSDDTLCLVVQGEADRVGRLVKELAPEWVPAEETAAHSAVLLANLDVSPHWLQVLLGPGRQTLPVSRWTAAEEPGG